MSAESVQPYEALAALIERELQLVSQRSFDELETLKEVRTELESSLPATPPEAARATLERCRQLQKRVEIELLRVREVLLLELGRVRQAQRTADGYAPARRRVSVIAATA
ncbi:MAG TPA: hypothetical protein VHW96_06205 [Solirubrobacteraceae bacterium]|jgi:hypothetical protein|nr:hypothetical protein [Solirubrobacteraceae bacterium]